MDQIINHAVLSLDFWQDTVTYEGSTMPTGTIGCEVLNIPDSTIEKLDTPCNVLNQLLQGMNTGSVDMELLPQVQQAAGEIISFLQVTPPFSRLNRSYFEQKLAAIFSEEYMEDAKAYLQLTQQEQLICALTGQHSKATMLVRIAQVLGHLSYSLGQYKEALTKFAERLNEPGYAHHFIGNALLTCRMQEEAGSFENVDEYKAVRGIAWLYNQSGQSEQAAIQKYVRKNGCTEETAAKFLALAKQNRSRVPFYQTVQDEDSEETGEDVSRDDHWDYAEILWNGIQAEAVREAFEKLNYREQTLLEKRNAICMTCGRVSPISTRLTFEELAALFEGSTASGAERAYRKAVEHLTCLLAEAGVLHMIRLKRQSQTKHKKKIAVVVYLYQVDNDGEWGEISFDFEAGTAEIIQLAEWDTTVSKKFAQKAIQYILTCNAKLCKETTLIYE